MDKTKLHELNIFETPEFKKDLELAFNAFTDKYRSTTSADYQTFVIGFKAGYSIAVLTKLNTVVDAEKEKTVPNIGIVPLILMLIISICSISCDRPATYYSDIVVRYDTSQFKVLNDSIALRKASNTYYRVAKGYSIHSPYRWVRVEAGTN